ncbi:hypothetical protein NPIL_146011 [Nephila pilipes]|uniref:SCA7 domain-containing protein n=1 Tax=Nephila pilipes TaxID=299642 RepID=A0A8X6QA19_NEPPI|nr:hypothetical protein NPIL_146011 [Nephila pilipes]
MISIEKAYNATLLEILEYLLEDIVFDVHRSIKLGYYSLNEYVIQGDEIGIYDPSKSYKTVENSKNPAVADVDIFRNKQNKVDVVSETCPFCYEKTNCRRLGYHLHYKCKKRERDFTEDCIVKISQIQESRKSCMEKGTLSEDETLSYKGITQGYEYMTEANIQFTLMKFCGVVCSNTKKPCKNSLYCGVHSVEDKSNIRNAFLDSQNLSYEADDFMDVDEPFCS